MSSYEELAAPAPHVEPAEADAVHATEDLHVQAAIPSAAVRVEAARAVEPAVMMDDPKQFAPPIITPEEASSLSVKALRGGKGVDFESQCAVIQGRVERNFIRKLLPAAMDERDFVAMGEVQRYVVVKGNCIFVYGQESDSRPLYAIQMSSIIAEQEDPKKPDRGSYTISPRVNTNEARSLLVTILLKDRQTKKQIYQFTFATMNDRGVAKRFLDVLECNAKVYGEDLLLASVVKAKSVK